MKYPIELVLKVNEIFHDVEGSDYYHSDIIKYESIRWQKIGKQFIANNTKKINLLDIGSGTGFVPLQIGRFLKNKDLVVCSDLSEILLNVCKKKISKKGFKCKFSFLKIDGKSYNLESEKFNYITLNSVLHHIPNFSTFFKEINRMLKKNGQIIIGHEPNKLFTNHKFLWYNFRFFYLLFRPKELLIAILKIFRIYSIIKMNYYRFFNHNKTNSNEKVKYVNKHLLSEGIIKEPLTRSQITEIVDIHSPTAGGFHQERGINIFKILKTYLPNFKIVNFESYNHLKRMSFKNFFTKRYDSFLRKKYPLRGATFFVILKKIG